MKEARSLSRSAESTAATQITIICSLPAAGNFAPILADLLASAEAWSEKGRWPIAIIAVDETAENTGDAPKTFGPVKLVRHRYQEPWPSFLARLLDDITDDWVVVVGQRGLATVAHIEAVITSLADLPYPTVGVFSTKEEPRESHEALVHGHGSTCPQRVVAFAAPRHISLLATRLLPTAKPGFPVSEWWESVEQICRSGNLKCQTVALPLPLQRPSSQTRTQPDDAASTNETSVGRSSRLNGRLSSELFVLGGITLVGTLLSLLLDGKLAVLSRWVSTCVGFSLVSLWTLQKLILPVVGRAAASLKFTAEVLAPRLQLAASFHLAIAATGATFYFQRQPPSPATTLDALLLALATATAILGIHLFSWARILQSLTKPTKGP